MQTPAPPDLCIRPARPDERLPLYRMLELYQHDLSDIWDQDLDAHGDYGYALDKYGASGGSGSSAGHQAFVFQVAGCYAGFALVDARDLPPPGTGPGPASNNAPGHWMAQFFVLRKYRRRGVGHAAANQLFTALPGRWQVGQMPLNTPAQAFWRRVISAYTHGDFVECRIDSGAWQGVLQSFDSATAAGRAGG